MLKVSWIKLSLDKLKCGINPLNSGLMNYYFIVIKGLSLDDKYMVYMINFRNVE